MSGSLELSQSAEQRPMQGTRPPILDSCSDWWPRLVHAVLGSVVQDVEFHVIMGTAHTGFCPCGGNAVFLSRIISCSWAAKLQA